MRDADGGRQPRALEDALLDLARHVLAAAEEADAARHVEEGLVEREALDEVRELAENREYLGRDLAIALEPRRDDDRLRTAPQRLAHRHRRVHAEAAHFVTRGRDHAARAGAPDHDRLAGELGVVVLLHGRVERVHVHVQDHPCGVAHDSDSIVITSPRSIVKPSSRT